MKKLLNFEVFGQSNSKKIVLIAHGLFGSLKNWRSIGKHLAELGFRAAVVDMRNHGLSFWDDSQTYEDMAGDLRFLINQFGTAVDLIGHSMGGKAAMALALLYPHLVKKLVVVDIAPVKYLHNPLSHIDAMRSVDLQKLTTRAELNKQLAFNVSDPSLRAFFCQSVDFSDKSNLRWNLNLDSLERNLTDIMDFPTMESQNLAPMLVIRGALSEYVLDKHLPMIETYFPNYKEVTIQNAGHWVHSECRDEFESRLLKFLFP